jgi:hypothetical protein
MNHLRMIPSIVGSILQSHECENTFILSFCFTFLFLNSYYILFYAISLYFLFIKFFATPSFSALGEHLVYLVVKLAVQLHDLTLSQIL